MLDDVFDMGGEYESLMHNNDIIKADMVIDRLSNLKMHLAEKL